MKASTPTDNLNIPIIQDFVKPLLCNELLVAGLHVKTNYLWVVNESIADLFTDAFDPDNYYKDSFSLLAAFKNASNILPAFQIRDMERLLPPYLLSKSCAGYELSLERMYDMPTITGDRLPDVYAMMVLECLRKRLLTAELCIKLLCGQEKKV